MVDIKTILCPVDGSDFSRRALDRAFAIARWYGSTVHVLHIAEPPRLAIPGTSFFGPAPLPIPAPPTTALDIEHIATRIRSIVDVERVPEVQYRVDVIEATSVYREILQQTVRLGADLIVMGTHGRSGFERLFLGSVAERVLRSSPVPVMTVPWSTPDAMPRGPLPFTRILCAVDFAPPSLHALAYAATLAGEADAVLTLLYVLERVPHLRDAVPTAEAEEGWIASARHDLHALVTEPLRSCCTVQEVLASGRAHERILEEAARRDSDLIVMGARGHAAADLLLFGSTTHRVICAAHCPVLSLREPVVPRAE